MVKTYCRLKSILPPNNKYSKISKYGNRNNGLRRDRLLKIYHSLIRSKIDYGCQIYRTASKTLLQNLTSIQNSCLRICTGAFRTSPSLSLCCEAGEPPL